MIYKYAQLDNRNTPDARAHNEAIFASGPVWGLEVTQREWAQRCDVNIDPQHGNSCVRAGLMDPLLNEGQLQSPIFEESKAACEVALLVDVNGHGPSGTCPPSETVFLFDRVDLDAVCAAAIFELRWEFGSRHLRKSYAQGMCDTNVIGDPRGFAARLRAVAEADNFAVGKTPWQRYPLPTAENPWPGSGSVDSRRELAAINRAVMDRSVPLEQRVEWVKDWLLTGEEPIWFDGTPGSSVSYRARVEHERQEIVAALAEYDRLRDETNGPWSGDVIVHCVEPLEPLNSYGHDTEANDDATFCRRCHAEAPYQSEICTADDSVSVIEMPGKPYPGATGLGFALAPITICVAEHFQPGDYRKVTIASWGILSPDQMGAIRDRLNELELGWGGNLQSGILGSPQGRSTQITVEQVLNAIRNAIRSVL